MAFSDDVTGAGRNNILLPGWRAHVCSISLAGLFLFANAGVQGGGEPTVTGTGAHSVTDQKAASVPEISVPEPKGAIRVTAAAAFQPANAAPGETVTLLVKVRIASGHWIYALGDSGSQNLPTTVTIGLAKPQLTLLEPWRGPAPKVKADETRVYTSEAVLQARVKIDPGMAKGAQRIPVALKYQACNEAFCWPPATISLEPVLTVIPSP